MNKLLIIFLSFLSLFSNAQEYNIKNIPDSLLLNANAIVRKEIIDYTVKTPSKSAYKYLFAVTLLNKSADDYGRLVTYYDRLSSISNLKAVLYDSNGNKLKEFKGSDFKDESVISNSTMYDDNRRKYLHIFHPAYPYTVEFSYSQDFNSILGYPSWYPQVDFNLSVQSSEYVIRYPQEMNVRFKENNTSPIKDAIENKLKIVQYSDKNIKAIPYEPLTAGLGKIAPSVLVSPTNFEYDGYPGDLSNWKTFGEWLYGLSKDLDVLPQFEKDKILALTKDIKDERDKVKVIYKYLQSKSRYISVQLGIGGFRPFPAEKVASNSYGDCKALSNYMLALLKEAGINSHLVVVGANPKAGLRSDFSSAGQANHMILCVPMEKDSIWLECTSQRAPFNYLGSFTEGRNVLLVTPEGGKIVKTPSLTPKDNALYRNATVSIDKEGNALAKLKTTYLGEQFEDIQYQLYKESKEQKDYIYSSLEVANPQIIDYKYEQKDKDLASIDETLELNISKIITSVGDRKFLTLNMLNKRTFVPEKTDARKTDIKLSGNYYDKDEIVYDIPDGFKVEFLPKETLLDTEFGYYKSSAKNEGNKIYYTREQTMYKKVFPATKINELADFYRNIYKADKQKAVLVSD